MTLSTHVLDATLGRPAAGVAVRLEAADGTELAAATTDADGRIASFASSAALAAATYRLRFDTAGYFAATQQTGFYPEVVLTFSITDPEQHHHVPLLLSPYAYSTYRGS